MKPLNDNLIDRLAADYAARRGGGSRLGVANTRRSSSAARNGNCASPHWRCARARSHPRPANGTSCAIA